MRKQFLLVTLLVIMSIMTVGCSDSKKDLEDGFVAVDKDDYITDSVNDSDVLDEIQDLEDLSDENSVTPDEDSVTPDDDAVADTVVDEDTVIPDEDEVVDTVVDEDSAIMDDDEIADEDTDVYPCSVDQCYINDACIDDGVVDSLNLCQNCDVAKDQLNWSFRDSETVCGIAVGNCDVASKCSGDSAICPANTDDDSLCDSANHKACIDSNCACDTGNDYHAGTDGTCCIDECYNIGASCLGGILQECSVVNDCKVLTSTSCASGSCQDDSTCKPAIGSMVAIPDTTFWQGCRTDVNGSTADTNCYSQESPYHQVSVPTFKMDVYEVTNAQYIEFLNANGNTCFANECVDSDASTTYFKLLETGEVWSVESGFENSPLVYVTWYGAKAYCEWAGKRLPTESEWELAARGTDERLYPWGDETATCDYAVMYNGTNGCGTNLYWAVGSKPSGISFYGLFDMAGNVWEWVEDDWHDDYSVTGRPDDGSAWIDSPRGSSRVLRGGSWLYSDPSLRASARGLNSPDGGYNYLGFRCASE